jgi:hypothetical protein
LLITAAIRAGRRASSSASMLLPRPEISMTMLLSVTGILACPWKLDDDDA